MSNSDLFKLIEVFPHISEEFLNGICDAHKDDNATIEELIEVVLSFEFPPPKENVEEHSLNTSNVNNANDSSSDRLIIINKEVPDINNSNIEQPASNGPMDTKSEIPSINNSNIERPASNGPMDIKSEMPSINNSNIEEPASNGTIVIKSEMPVVNKSNIEQSSVNEVLQKSLNEDSAVQSRDKELRLENLSCDISSCGAENSVDKELFNEVSCDSEVINGSHVANSKTKADANPGTKLEVSSDSAVKIQSTTDLNGYECDKYHDQHSVQEEDDSSPECSIKYLMKEDNFMEQYYITTHFIKLEQVSEGNTTISSGDGEQTSHSPCDITSGSSPMPALTSKSTGAKQNKIRPRKRKISSLSEDISSPTLSLCSTKQVTLRSCKVKNEEERLRRRLLSQTRLLHKKEIKNTNSPCSSKFLNIENKYSLLCKIFPDACPTYLLDQCEVLTDQEKILTFISQNLELRVYPKKETLKEEPNMMDQIHCTISEFLEVIPDPEAEFSSDKYIRAGYEENAEIYLKGRYPELSYSEAKLLLGAFRYNLTTVCSHLEEEGKTPTPGVLDFTPLHHPANLFFYQEVWYIEHRKEVQDYMASAIEAIRIEEELNRPPLPVEEVFECEICREEIVEYINLGTCDGPTGHLFCIDCIRRSVEVRIGDGETKFPCLVNCGSFIPLRTVEELLSKHVFDKLMGRIQEEEIRKANIAGVETCPFCPYAYGPGEETLFMCLNPSCMKLSCRICRKKDHSPDLCEMFKNEDEERARLIIENSMAEALIRTCHNCRKNIVKSSGCNKMACTCGALMCYVCRQPVKDYSHFNGQGGDDTDKCPLWSKDEELHVQPVEATAEQVFSELAANNPHLKLDRAKLIPK